MNSLANLSAKLAASKLPSLEDLSESSESAAGANQLFRKYSGLCGIFAKVPGGDLTRGAKYSNTTIVSLHRHYLLWVRRENSSFTSL